MSDLPVMDERLREAFAAHLSSGEDHYFVINCKDGNDFKIHRNIIAAHSDFFRAVVSSNFSEGISRTISLPEDEPALVARMLAFMYTGEYCVTSLSNTPSGLDLAQFRHVQDAYKFDE